MATREQHFSIAQGLLANLATAADPEEVVAQIHNHIRQSTHPNLASQENIQTAIEERRRQAHVRKVKKSLEKMAAGEDAAIWLKALDRSMLALGFNEDMAFPEGIRNRHQFDQHIAALRAQIGVKTFTDSLEQLPNDLEAPEKRARSLRQILDGLSYHIAPLLSDDIKNRADLDTLIQAQLDIALGKIAELKAKEEKTQHIQQARQHFAALEHSNDPDKCMHLMRAELAAAGVDATALHYAFLGTISIQEMETKISWTYDQAIANLSKKILGLTEPHRNFDTTPVDEANVLITAGFSPTHKLAIIRRLPTFAATELEILERRSSQNDVIRWVVALNNAIEKGRRHDILQREVAKKLREMGGGINVTATDGTTVAHQASGMHYLNALDEAHERVGLSADDWTKVKQQIFRTFISPKREDVSPWTFDQSGNVRVLQA